jgi:hypothetical protein
VGSISSASVGGALVPAVGIPPKSPSGGAPPPDGGLPPVGGGLPAGGLPRGHHGVPCRPNIRFISLTSRSRNVLQLCPVKYRVTLLVTVCILTELVVAPLC